MLTSLSLQVVYRVLSSIDEKIKQSARERKERKQFEINYDGTNPLVDTMSVEKPYSSATDSVKQHHTSGFQQPEA
jgi:hypothetical protein